MLKTALLYEKGEAGAVRCRLCAHHCLVKPGKRGLCGVRENREGVLYSLVYGKVSALALDPIEKKPLYHFLPGTATYSLATVGCNFTCAFCQNAGLSQAAPGETGVRDLTPEAAVSEALASGARSLSYTYSEPTIFLEYALDIGRLARNRGLRNIFVTNGFMGPDALPLLSEFLDAANVDLKCFSDDTYRRVIGGRLAPVLNNIRALHRMGVHLEITTLLIPGLNDSEAEVRETARFIAGVSPGIPWHVSRFHPDYRMADRPATPEASISRAVEIGREEGLHYVYAGNVRSRKEGETRCPSCRALLLQREGFRVLSQKIANGCCPGCGEKVSGVFD